MKYNETGVHNLASAMLLQATEDYFGARNQKEKNQIIKDLNSEWNKFFTDGMSLIVADKLKHNPGSIYRKYKEIQKKRGIQNEQN